MKDSEKLEMADTTKTKDELSDIWDAIETRMMEAQEEAYRHFTSTVLKALVYLVSAPANGYSSMPTEDELQLLYDRTDDENKKFLEAHGVTIHTIVGYMYFLTSWANIYCKGAQPKVNLSSVDGRSSVMEIYLIVLMLGSCHEDSNYKQISGTSVTFKYDGEGTCSLPIPGLSVNQMDAINQEVIKLISPILDQTNPSSYPAYSPNLTSAGFHGNRPTYCFAAPVYMFNGWTVPTSTYMANV
jgi:hypothetical protein